MGGSPHVHQPLISAFGKGILAIYNYPISTGFLEVKNIKIRPQKTNLYL
jgi:hypothetical protein